MAFDPAARLDGWKAIADYLVRDVRTAQRWRDERGMPVHSVPGRKGGAVCADRLELDAWLFHTTPTAEEPEIAAHSAESVLAHARPHDHSSLGRVRVLLSRARLVTGIAVGILAIGGIGVGVSRIGTTPAAAPVTMELNGTTLVAKAQDKSVLWSFRLSEERGTQAGIAAFVPIDWRAPDSPDAVVMVNVQEATESGSSFIRSDVYCFSSAGRLRWKYTPDARLSFAGRKFSGPWRIRSWHVLSAARPRLGASFIHQTWWPSIVVAFGPDGAAERLFVNAGHVESVARVEVQGRAYVMAGGINNEHRSAALAVLDEYGPAAVSPQSDGSPFACEDCPEGRPRKYFVFPRSEINVASGAPNSYADAASSRTANGSLEVSVRERMQGEPRAIYRLSPELMPESVAMSDRYWQIHDDLLRAGKLDHKAENCPERINGTIVRMWEPDTGWTNISVPPTFAARPSNTSQ
jgi:hypothetical protein